MLQWLLAMTPLVVGFDSKPIINALYAASQDEDSGIVPAIPSLASKYLAYVTHVFVIGLSYGWLVKTLNLSGLAQYIGAGCLGILAYLIVAREKRVVREKYLSFAEEYLINLIRPTVPLIVIVMLSIFVDPAQPLGAYVGVMAIGLVLLSFLTQLGWVIASMVSKIESFDRKKQMYFDWAMAIIYILTAVVVVVF